MIAARINIVRELDNGRMTIETMITKRQGMIIFFLSYISNTLPPRERPRMRVMAKKMKKIPGLDTPCFRAYRGKKALKLPQMMLTMKDMIEDGSASRLRNGCVFRGLFSNGTGSFFPNFVAMKKEHKDIPVHARKRTTKLKWLMRSIPKNGPRAKDKLFDK
jgi:hypothetical protein